MIIDIHGHITSPELLRRFPMPPSLGDVEGMIEAKAALGIGMTIVGSPVGAGTMVPVPGLDNYAQPADRLEAFHDWVAETVGAHPGHLRAYAYVNPLGADKELDRAAQLLKQEEFVALIVNTSVGGQFLDSGRADAFFALAQDSGVPVLLHPPAEPVGSAAVSHPGLLEHVVRPCDVTLGVAAIIFAGWLEKYPGLRLIATVAGGALPLLVEKLDLAWQRDHARSTVAPSVALRAVSFDTATPSASALGAAVGQFGADRLLFGTDSPPMTAPLQHAVERVERLPIPPEERDQILAANAMRLFGLAQTGGADDQPL